MTSTYSVNGSAGESGHQAHSSSEPSPMLEEYASSDTTITERIAMGGSSQAVSIKEAKKRKRKEAKKVVDDFETQWERASGSGA